MPDRTTSIRHLQLMRILSATRTGMSLTELATEFEVSEKTIRRDLTAFETAGLSLVCSAGDHGRRTWRLEHDLDVPAAALDFMETAAVYLGRQFLEPLAGTELWDASQAAFAKLRQQFRPSALRYLESLACTIHSTPVGQSDYAERSHVIDTLMQSQRELRVVRALYHPARSASPEEYHLQPLGIIWHRGTLYVVAATAVDATAKHFKVDRIRDAEVLDEPFERRTDFDLQQHLTDSFGAYQKSGPLQTVRLHFAEPVARYVTEHHWHHSETFEEQPDGSLIVELQLSDLTEVKSWILGFGSQVVVIAPEALRGAVQQELDLTLAAYQRPCSVPGREHRDVGGTP